MNKQNNINRLKHIYDAIVEIENYTKNIELEQSNTLAKNDRLKKYINS